MIEIWKSAAPIAVISDESRTRDRGWDPLGDQEGSTISIQEEETEIAIETIIKVTKVTSQDRCQTTGKTVVSKL